MSRQEASDLLMAEKEGGVFLVRVSLWSADSVSVRTEQKEIRKRKNTSITTLSALIFAES